MTRTPHTPGRKRLEGDARKISVSAAIPLPVYDRLIEAVTRQHKSISSAVAEAVEVILDGGPAGQAAQRPVIFAKILAATLEPEANYLETLDEISREPAKLINYVRDLPPEHKTLLADLKPEYLSAKLTVAESAQMELAYLQARG